MYINTPKDCLIKFCRFLLAHISIQIVLMLMLARVRELQGMCAAIKACLCHSLNVQKYLIRKYNYACRKQRLEFAWTNENYLSVL